MNAESLPLNYTKDGKIVESIWKITFSKAPYTNWFIKEIIRETIFPNMKGNKKMLWYSQRGWSVRISLCDLNGVISYALAMGTHHDEEKHFPKNIALLILGSC